MMVDGGANVAAWRWTRLSPLWRRNKITLREALTAEERLTAKLREALRYAHEWLEHVDEIGRGENGGPRTGYIGLDHPAGTYEDCTICAALVFGGDRAEGALLQAPWRPRCAFFAFYGLPVGIDGVSERGVFPRSSYGLARANAVVDPRSESTYQGRTARWWAKRAVQARRDANKRGQSSGGCNTRPAASAHFFGWLQAADCVHRHESIHWDAATGNSYYGGMQADAASSAPTPPT